MTLGCTMPRISRLLCCVSTLLLLFSLVLQGKNYAVHAQNTAAERRVHSSNTETMQIFRAPRSIHTEHYAQLQLTFAVLLPHEESDNRNDCIMPKVMPVLELGIANIQQLGFPNAHVDVQLITRNTFCSSMYGPVGLVEIYYRYQPLVTNAVLGLPCEYVLAAVSRLAGAFAIPVLTTSGNADTFKNKNDFPTLTRLKGAQVNNLGEVLDAILEHFNWTHTTLLYENEKIRGNSLCYFCMSAVHDTLRNKSTLQIGFEMSQRRKGFVDLLKKISLQTRVVIMCADPQTIREIMLTAGDMKMVDSGEYVFINIELFSRVPHITSEPWFDKNDTKENNERARNAYTALLTVTPKQPNDDNYIDISNKIKDIAAAKYNYTFQDNEPISAFVTSFFDGVLLYANALNDSIREDPTVLTRPINGTDMVRRMWNRSFTGITGNVTIDANGDRLSAYSLLDMNPATGRFEIMAHFLHNRLEFVAGKEIHWSGNRLEPPLDKPVCGYDGLLCPDNSLPGYAILSIVLGVVVLIMTVCFFFGYRHYKSEAEINSMAWKVLIDDVLFHDAAGRYPRGSFHSLVKHNSQLTLLSDDMGSLYGDRQQFIPVGIFKGCKVAIKSVDERNISLTRSLMLELKRMKDLQHDHLVKFYGACLDPPKSFLLTEYCPKGSLQDILENEQFQLDWMFKLSLMHDIVRGMQFLHSSDIKSHGNLKSSNCVVDSRFVLKITDFGLHDLKKLRTEKELDVENCNSHAYWSKFIWTAPELLRMEPNRPAEGTQKGDVYSFGIIVNEIATRQGPFYLGKDNPEKSPQEIVELVKGYPHLSRQPFRPLVVSADNYVDINGIMIKCWAEDPLERPDFNTLKSIIRKINKDNETGNIVDNLLKRMEQYANNLEELVEERTQDYIEEKKKCEKLLYQLLPQSVAAQLIRGQPVVAETFDQVTIYFSDIVGFTSISAESTPLQVVQFLNDLYTCFDSIVENFDVYKVETIGDAYMVVSGLPIQNGNQHAREIARLALALLEAVHNFQIHHRPNDRLRLRIGLHTGACVAGVVGLKMPRYCLFGDTVNTASRMESNGEALKIHISDTTKMALDEFGTFITTRRGYVPMKGKGEMLTHWLEGEVAKPDSPIPPSKLLLSRRSSLKQPQRHGLQKQNSDVSPFPPPYQLNQQPVTAEQRPADNKQGSPTLRVKRKISSSSPKLNGGGDYKTEDFNYYLEMIQASDKDKTNVAKLARDATSDIYTSRSLRESNKESSNAELANFRLPLSGALKNHNSNSLMKNSYTQLLTSNSNSNLSGILQPTGRLRLKASPTIATLTRSEFDNGSLNSGSRIKFCITEDVPEAVAEKDYAGAAPKEEDDDDDDEEEDFNEYKLSDRLNGSGSKMHLLDNNSSGNNTSSNSTNLHLSHNSCGSSNSNNSSSSNNYNNIVKANNVKNFKLLCKNSSNNMAADNSGGGSGGSNAVAQPLLAKINS